MRYILKLLVYKCLEDIKHEQNVEFNLAYNVLICLHGKLHTSIWFVGLILLSNRITFTYFTNNSRHKLFFHCLLKAPKSSLNRHRAWINLCRPPCCFFWQQDLCRFSVTWRDSSTCDTHYCYRSLKFTGFHNQSPLLTMVKCFLK